MEAKYEVLFTPFSIGKCEIRNRFVIPAMEGTNIIDNMGGPECKKTARQYYVDRARNGVGLFIPGMIPVFSMVNKKWLHDSPEVFEEAKEIVDAIHENGAKIFFQLGAGFMGRNYILPAQALAVAGNPDARKAAEPVLALDEMMVAPDDGLPMVWAPQYTTRALTKEEIRAYVDAYAKAAKLAKDIGVDGVEVHAVHEGYLMDQFTTEYTNHRTDEYGGSFENRYRFPVEVVQAIKRECGDDFPVMLRYSVTSKVIDYKVGAVPGEEFEEKGRDMAESEKAAKYLQDAGYDALNADNGSYDSWYWAHPPVYMPLNCNLEEAKHIKKFVDIPVICAGRLQADAAAEAISDGELDGAGIARQFLTDAEFIPKLKEGRYDEIRPCIACHNGCLPVGYYKNSGAVMPEDYGKTAGMCAINPVAFQEDRFTIQKTDKPKRIAVVGGGIGGMEASRLLAMMGHEVTIYEKGDELGGVFVAAAAPAFKEKDKELIQWYKNEISRLPVTVKLNTEVESLDDLDADEIIIATGAKARQLPIAGFEKGVEAIDYLLDNAEIGETVAVIGGGVTGCEIAYDLALKGRKPFIVEMLDDLIKVAGVSAANSECLRDLIRYHKIPVYLESTLKEIKDGSVVINTPDGEKEIPCDTTVLSVGYVPEAPLATDAPNVHAIGDAVKVGNLKNVIWAAYDTAFAI